MTVPRTGFADEAIFADVVGSIYATAGNQLLWRDALEKVARAFGAFGSQLSLLDRETQKPELNLTFGYEWLTPARLRRYEELLPTDPRLPYGIAHLGMPSHCRQACDYEVLRASDIYKELLGPGDCEYSASFGVPHEGNLAFLGIVRHAAQGVFTQDDMGRLGLLIPHLRRTLMLQKMFSQAEHVSRLAGEAFDALPFGVAIVAEGGATIFANGIARTALGAGEGRSLVIPPSLRREVETRLAIPSIHAVAPTMTTKLRSGRPGGGDIRVTLSDPTDERLRPLLGSLNRRCVAIFVDDPEIPLESLPEKLERMYGLTAAEVGAALDIVAGKPPKRSARDRGVTVDAVRKHLKRVFRKTRTSGQLELAALVGNLPLWPAEPPPRLDAPDAAILIP